MNACCANDEGGIFMRKLQVTKDIEGIKGLCLIEPKVFEDNRGIFIEVYNEKEFFEEGLVAKFVQDNEVHNKKGVFRGFHVNCKHPQGKLVRVLSGTIFDVVIDLRKESKTYEKVFSIELSSKNRKQLYIPEGFAHGYLSLDDSDIIFKVTTHYVPNDELGFSWDSKEFNIGWPCIGEKFILSTKDESNPNFSELEI